MGDVASGLIKEIHIRGGPGCSWVAAFADQILGLRVAVRSIEGAILTMTYDSSVATAQVNLQFCNDLPSESIACVGRVFYVPHGNDFIQQCFHGLANLASSSLNSQPFLGGRVKWDVMFRETFGKDADDLFSPSPSSTNSFAKILVEPLGLDHHFAQLFVAGAAVYTFFTPEACRYGNPTEFVLAAMSSIPELCPHRQKLLNAASHYTKFPSTKNVAYEQYRGAGKALTRQCHCPTHSKVLLSENGFQNGVQGVYCLPRIAETALVLAYLLGSLLLHEPLMPKRYGILNIYKDLSRVSSAFVCGHSPDTDFDFLGSSDIHSFDALQSRLTRDQGLLELSYRFSMYVTLFSGEPPPVVLGASTSAMSDGKVYCYIDTLQSLSDRFEKSSIIHVGAGSIQAGNRLYYTVFDGTRQDENLSLGYQTRKVELIEKGLLPFAEDFTTSDLRIEAVVEESIRLAFSYRIYSMAGEITISPGSFVKQRLAKAVKFKTQGLDMIPDHGIVDEYVSVIYGEGVITQQKSTRLTVRPHRGNTLGRCVALVTSSLPVALLCSESDLSTFTKVWALANETNSPGENLYFTLIS